jgi:hypothetical protein
MTGVEGGTTHLIQGHHARKKELLDERDELIEKGAKIKRKSALVDKQALLHDGTEIFLLDVCVMLETDHLTIAKMLATHLQALKGVGAATVAVVADNASNLRRTFDQTKESETLQSLVDGRIIDIRCLCHSLSLATTDLARIVPEFVVYRNELIARFVFVRTKKVREFLRQLGVTGTTPFIQEIKWMTWLEAGTYVGDNAVHTNEAIRYFKGNKKNPNKMPDNFVVMNSALSVLGNLLKFAQGDFVLLCQFYPRYRECLKELQEQASFVPPFAVNPAAGLLQAIEERSRRSSDVVRTE